MAITSSKEILRRIRVRGKGCVFTASDFLNVAPRASVDQTLSRLARRDVIRRLAHGIYDYPRVHEKLGILSPSPNAIAQAIARRDNIRVQPAGEATANALGLSTQVPAKITYVTDGRSRTIAVAGHEIEFRHVPPARLLPAGGGAALAASALRYLGRDESAAPGVVQTLSKSLRTSDKRRLAKSMRYMPTWMHPVAGHIAESESE